MNLREVHQFDGYVEPSFPFELTQDPDELEGMKLASLILLGYLHGDFWEFRQTVLTLASRGDFGLIPDNILWLLRYHVCQQICWKDLGWFDIEICEANPFLEVRPNYSVSNAMVGAIAF